LSLKKADYNIFLNSCMSYSLVKTEVTVSGSKRQQFIFNR